MIKKLVMHGFKSFANRTEIPFSKGFNVIIGPNGSGKSNVLDAICFVLGRMSAKSMRVEKGSSLIFNGGKNRAPMDKASVSIVFDNENRIFNSDEDEVKITRTIKTDGQSIYKINDKKTTRNSVLELLGSAKINPEGYNIVLQGDVVNLIEMNNIEKRGIIEEISGIAQYEEKKKKAEAQLENVKERINEASIILSERESYLKELKKERDQTLKYKEMKEKIDQNRATLLYIELSKKTEELEKLNSRIEKTSKTIESINQAISDLKEEIARKKEEINAISEEIEKKGEQEQIQLNKELENLKVETEKGKLDMKRKQQDLLQLASREENLEKQISELKEKRKLLIKENDSIAQEIKRKSEELNKLKKEAERLKQGNLEESARIEARIEEIESKTEALTNNVQELREKQQELLREKDKLEYSLQNIDARIQKVNEMKKQHKKEMDELSAKKDEFKRYTLNLNRLLNEESEKAAVIGELKKKSIQIRERLEVLRIKNESAKRSSAANIAIQKILELKSSNKGIFGLIRDLGKTQSKYSKALDSAAGGMLNYVVVDNDKTAADCINYLKEKKLGFASFIPLNKIKPFEIKKEDKELVNIEGVIDFAINLINTSPEYKKAFRFVLGNTLVVRDINVARRIGVGRIRMVTLDGDIVEASGLMRGGFRQSSKSEGFRTEEFSKEIEELETELSSINSKINSLSDEKEQMEKEIEDLRKKKAELEGIIIKLEKSLYVEDEDLEADENKKKELENQLKEINKELSSVNDNIVDINRELAKLKTERQNLKEEISKTRDPAKIAELSTYEESIRNLEREIINQDSESKYNKNKVESYDREIEEIEMTRNQLSKDKEEINLDIEQLKKKINENESTIKQMEKKMEDFYVEFKEMFKKRNDIEKSIAIIENEISKKQDEQRELEKKQNLDALVRVQLEGEKKGLESQMERYRDIEIIKDADLATIKREIAKFEKLMEELGTVNMKALEIYDKVNEEYNSLLEKKKTLEKERNDVIKLIESLEQKKKENFIKTFNVVKENFTRIFSELFPKEGSAYLKLDDEQDPFKGGLSINVKLGTNKYQDLRSLSGGEKTMTALAFIFALQEFEPALFYVLDEVDSSLDKRNCQKLEERIRKYSKKAQYIVISHNDAMIAGADCIFGTSMNDSVSKIISLKL